MFIYNLFGEDFHLMLVLYLDLQELEHYLDNFIFIIKARLATSLNQGKYNNNYWLLTDWLSISCQDTKDCINTIVFIFDIEIDINLFVV